MIGQDVHRHGSCLEVFGILIVKGHAARGGGVVQAQTTWGGRSIPASNGIRFAKERVNEMQNHSGRWAKVDIS